MRGIFKAVTRSKRPADVINADNYSVRLLKGNFGERLATDILAQKGYKIIFAKPELAGTHQPGFDIVTYHNGRVYFIDNKAYMRDGYIYSAPALTRNFQTNLNRFVAQLNAMMQNKAYNTTSRQLFSLVLKAIAEKRYSKIVTNAAFTPAGKQLKGVSESLKKQGVDFLNVI